MSALLAHTNNPPVLLDNLGTGTDRSQEHSVRFSVPKWNRTESDRETISPSEKAMSGSSAVASAAYRFTFSFDSQTCIVIVSTKMLGASFCKFEDGHTHTMFHIIYRQEEQWAKPSLSLTQLASIQALSLSLGPTLPKPSFPPS